MFVFTFIIYGVVRGDGAGEDPTTTVGRVGAGVGVRTGVAVRAGVAATVGCGVVVWAGVGVAA